MGRPKKRKKSGDTSKRLRPSTAEKLDRMVEQVSKMEQRVATWRDSMERFRDRDLPEFERWVSENLSEERNELEELTKKHDVYQSIVDEADYFMSYEGAASFQQAVMRAYRNAEECGDFDNADWDSEDETDVADEIAGNGDEMDKELAEDLMASFMVDVLGVDPDSLSEEEHEQYRSRFEETFRHAREGNRTGFESAMRDILAQGQQKNRPAAKAIYRRLVKRLHPDHHGDFTPSEKQIWEEAAIAYQMHNAEGLEILDLRLSIIRGEPIGAAQATALKAYRDQLFREDEILREELEEFREHPGWEFSIREKTEAFFQGLRDDLFEAIAEARARLSKLQSFVEEILSSRPRSTKKKSARKKAPRKTPAKKSGNKRKHPPQPPAQDEFPF